MRRAARQHNPSQGHAGGRGLRRALAVSLALGVPVLASTTSACHLIGGIDEGTPACRVDGVRNGLEVDVDCGGPCPACADGAHCNGHSDCASNSCKDLCSGPSCDAGPICQPPSCGDGRRNGAETDVDCGSADDSCDRCFGGAACLVDGDCGAPPTDGRRTCVEGRCLSSCCGEDCGPDCGCPDGSCCDGYCGDGHLGGYCNEVEGPDCEEPLTCYYDEPDDGECW